MSEFGELIDATTVRFERLLPGPIERVWSYLVEGEKCAKWLRGGATELRVGGRVDMHFHNASLSAAEDIERPEKYKDLPEKMSFSGKVTLCEPPSVLAHTWEFGDEASEICFELQQQGDKVRLILTHRKLEEEDSVLERHRRLAYAPRYPDGCARGQRAAPVLENSHGFRGTVRAAT